MNEDPLLTDLKLGAEGDLAETPTGDLAVLSGVPNVRQALLRRMLCAPGELVWAPRHGGGLVTSLERLNSPANRLLMAQLGRANLLQDRRVASAQVTVTADARSVQRVSMEIVATTVTQQKLSIQGTVEAP